MARVARLFILLIPLVLLVAACDAGAPAPAGCVVDRVIDGDTIVVRGCEQQAHVRFLLINTPEIAHSGQAAECGGPEAKAYVESRLRPGMPVRLQAGVRDKDQYDRLLRYVWIGDELLNETLV